MQLPEGDRHTHSKEFLEAQLAILMGGRVAEELFTDRVTSGAGNDIERATDIARKMVCELGMSPFGPVAFRPSGGPWDDDRRWRSARRPRAGWTRKSASLVLRGYETARQVSRHRNAVAALAEELLEVESLDAEAIRALISESEQPFRVAARDGLQ